MIDFLSLKLERIIHSSRRRPSRISSRLFASSASSASRVGARARLFRARRHPSSSLVTVVALASRLDVHHRPVASRVTIADLIDFIIAVVPVPVPVPLVPHGAVDECE